MSGVTVAKYIIEAALFSAGKSITVEELSEATGLDRRTVRKSAKELVAEYSGRDSSLTVTKTATGLALEVKAKYARYTMKLADQEIPRMALKTLAIIAFHQPIKQSKLKMMIGGRAYEDVKILREMGLITVKPDGRSYRLETSSRFPDYFGIDPDPAEIKKHLADLVGVTLQEVPEGDDAEVEGAVGEGSEAVEGEAGTIGSEEGSVPEEGEPVGPEAQGEVEAAGDVEAAAEEDDEPGEGIVSEEPESLPDEAAEEPVEDGSDEEVVGDKPDEPAPEPEEETEVVVDEPPAEESAAEDEPGGELSSEDAAETDLDDEDDAKYGSGAMVKVRAALHDDGGI